MASVFSRQYLKPWAFTLITGLGFAVTGFGLLKAPPLKLGLPICLLTMALVPLTFRAWDRARTSRSVN